MKKLWKSVDLSLLIFLAGLVFAVLTFRLSKPLACIEAGVFVVLFLLQCIYRKVVKQRLLYQMNAVADELDYEKGKAFNTLSVACCVVDGGGGMLWLNKAFESAFEIDGKTVSCSLQQLLRRDSLEKLFEGRGFKIRFGERFFAVYSSEIPLESETLYLLYFFDETALRQTERAYYDSRPSVMLTVLDNADELLQTFKESECAAIYSMIEQMIDDWATSYGALCRKLAADRMFIIVEEKALQRMVSDKFNILDRVRDFTYEGKQTDLTLSIGVGREGNFHDSNNAARQSLDMAQSRGGDQAAIRHEAQYQFYGGVSAGVEHKNKAKTRLIAKTIAATVCDSEQVLIMGHRFSDYDAIGSAIGLYQIARFFGKEAHIVVDRTTTLSEPLCTLFEENGHPDAFISPEKALLTAGEGTLLFVTDTHKQDFTECPPLLERAGSVIVIDHHRKSVQFIENTVVFYHIPNASSASEMVTELAQYMDKKPILDPVSSLALFAGIMLDTRNFVLRAGVRTFEAAAYLRSRGANTVECKKLFSTDMDIFRARNKIIDSAVRYREVCAISTLTQECANERLITSQAADEMLGIENVKASFVLFRLGSAYHISARSYGEVNVQLVMEALGGGGHQTMAACQLGEIKFDDAMHQLKQAIDQVLDI